MRASHKSGAHLVPGQAQNMKFIGPGAISWIQDETRDRGRTPARTHKPRDSHQQSVVGQAQQVTNQHWFLLIKQALTDTKSWRRSTLISA